MSDSLEFRLLRYIVAVADTANFTRAAERLYLAQPSLSKQIKDLEEEIKFPIFRRDRSGVHVTPAGDMVLAYARETLKSRDELLAMARAVHLGEVPPLRVGFSAFVNAGLLQTFRADYCAMFPRCEMQLAGGDPSHGVSSMTRGKPINGALLSLVSMLEMNPGSSPATSSQVNRRSLRTLSTRLKALAYRTAVSD